jgi:DNA-binding transcriptional regulator YdaS (Cro superfamily)
MTRRIGGKKIATRAPERACACAAAGRFIEPPHPPRAPARVRVMRARASPTRTTGRARMGATPTDPPPGTNKYTSDTPLSAWLEAHDVSQFELAQKLGCDPKMVNLWATGRSEIGLIYAFMLERATGGGVPVAAWLGTELFKLRMRRLGVDWEGLTQQRRAAERRRRARKAG